MTLTQLRYAIAVAHYSSIQKAASSLYISQPSLSRAIALLESELGISIFNRLHTGVSLTEDGYKFLSYARQVVEQADLLLSNYTKDHKVRRVFSISSHHYAFVVHAFVALVKEYTKDEYEFALRESRTFDIIEDVKTLRSELGIIYFSNYNREVMSNILKQHDLSYTSLFKAQPHVFLSKNHPLSSKDKVTFDDLLDYPRFTYDQGTHNSFYFSEELHSTTNVPKSIIVSDRATLFNLLLGLNGYTIASGILGNEPNGEQIVSVPLDSDECMELIAISPRQYRLSPLAMRYLEILQEYVNPFLTSDKE